MKILIILMTVALASSCTRQKIKPVKNYLYLQVIGNAYIECTSKTLDGRSVYIKNGLFFRSNNIFTLVDENQVELDIHAFYKFNKLNNLIIGENGDVFEKLLSKTTIISKENIKGLYNRYEVIQLAIGNISLVQFEDNVKLLNDKDLPYLYYPEDSGVMPYIVTPDNENNIKLIGYGLTK